MLCILYCWSIVLLCWGNCASSLHPFYQTKVTIPDKEKDYFLKMKDYKLAGFKVLPPKEIVEPLFYGTEKSGVDIDWSRSLYEELNKLFLLKNQPVIRLIQLCFHDPRCMATTSSETVYLDEWSEEQRECYTNPSHLEESKRSFFAVVFSAPQAAFEANYKTFLDSTPIPSDLISQFEPSWCRDDQRGNNTSKLLRDKYVRQYCVSEAAKRGTTISAIIMYINLSKSACIPTLLEYNMLKSYQFYNDDVNKFNGVCKQFRYGCDYNQQSEVSCKYTMTSIIDEPDVMRYKLIVADDTLPYDYMMHRLERTFVSFYDTIHEAIVVRKNLTGNGLEFFDAWYRINDAWNEWKVDQQQDLRLVAVRDVIHNWKMAKEYELAKYTFTGDMCDLSLDHTPIDRKTDFNNCYTAVGFAYNFLQNVWLDRKQKNNTFCPTSCGIFAGTMQTCSTTVPLNYCHCFEKLICECKEHINLAITHANRQVKLTILLNGLANNSPGTIGTLLISSKQFGSYQMNVSQWSNHYFVIRQETENVRYSAVEFLSRGRRLLEEPLSAYHIYTAEAALMKELGQIAVHQPLNSKTYLVTTGRDDSVQLPLEDYNFETGFGRNRSGCIWVSFVKSDITNLTNTFEAYSAGKTYYGREVCLQSCQTVDGNNLTDRFNSQALTMTQQKHIGEWTEFRYPKHCQGRNCYLNIHVAKPYGIVTRMPVDLVRHIEVTIRSLRLPYGIGHICWIKLKLNYGKHNKEVYQEAKELVYIGITDEGSVFQFNKSSYNWTWHDKTGIKLQKTIKLHNGAPTVFLQGKILLDFFRKGDTQYNSHVTLTFFKSAVPFKTHMDPFLSQLNDKIIADVTNIHLRFTWNDTSPAVTRKGSISPFRKNYSLSTEWYMKHGSDIGIELKPMDIYQCHITVGRMVNTSGTVLPQWSKAYEQWRKSQ